MANPTVAFRRWHCDGFIEDRVWRTPVLLRATSASAPCLMDPRDSVPRARHMRRRLSLKIQIGVVAFLGSIQGSKKG
jgi:hypothetical protein